MKTAFITDIHFGARADSALFSSNLKRFLDEVFFPTLIEQGIKRVVDLGDTWENRRTVHWKTWKVAQGMFFDRLHELGIELVMIYGNHDVTYRDTNAVNGVDFLERLYPNVRVIKTHAVMDIGVKLGLISWINKNNLEESLRWLETVDAEYLGGHFEIKDFEMTRGQPATHGFERDLFSRFKHVWSGHFHVRGTIGNITYLSNPNQTNWGDEGLDKGFHVFNSETGEMTPVNNPFPMFKDMVWGRDDFKPADFAGMYGRIRVPVFEDVSRAELDLFVSEANELSLGMHVEEAKLDQNGIAVESDEVETTSALLAAYIQDAVGGKEGLDAEVLNGMVQELYEDAAALLDVE